MFSRKGLNRKRRILADARPDTAYCQRLETLAVTISYGGNPEHKRNPGDFGLQPPSLPRQGKTLCDGVSIFKRAEALRLLREGARRGLISEQERNGWPQNIWSVTDSGIALEAQLENQAAGAYHGYPMLDDDPLSVEVIRRWNHEQ